MPGSDYIIVGRSRDCDLVFQDPTVSARHARLSWEAGRISVEDLGSANGTFVRGKRIERAHIRPGEDLRFGRASLRWGTPAMRPFLRRGAPGDTIQGISIPGRRFICGACGARGVMPRGFKKGQLRCSRCETSLDVGPARRGARGLLAATLVIVAAAAGVGLFFLSTPSGTETLRKAAERLGVPEPGVQAGSPQEASIRAHAAAQVMASIDPRSELTRNSAVRVAAGVDGPFSVEQVAKIWSHVRARWRYVNDPRGAEYFARASETIENDYAGDCDDFAIVLTSMILAIGGEARIVMMDGPHGGHAYAEACLQNTPEEIRDRLVAHYARHRDDNLGRQPLRNMHYRQSEMCSVWLNLDWNAGVPGGPYEPEAWAVAIYSDGQTETLGPAPGPEHMPAAAEQVGTPPR